MESFTAFHLETNENNNWALPKERSRLCPQVWEENFKSPESLIISKIFLNANANENSENWGLGEILRLSVL